MGLTATWVFAPADTPAGEWDPCEDLRAGWSGHMTMDPMRLETTPSGWSGLTGPMLMATVIDSGFAMLTGLRDRRPDWHWVLNERFFLGEMGEMAGQYGVPGDISQAVPAMIAWATAAGLPEPSAERLTEVLTDGQRDTLPVDGVAYALFAVLGITQFPGN